MSKKRIGIAVMALGMFLWAAAAYASPEAPRLLSPPMALPVPSGFLKVLLLLTFFVHLVLVNVLLGSVILSVIDRRASASDRKGGVAFMPKGPIPAHQGRIDDLHNDKIMFALRRLVRHAGVLRALRERRGGQAGAADPYTVPVRAAASDDGVSAEQRKYPDAAPGLLVPVVLRAARASFEHKRSHLIPALSAYLTGFSGCGRPDDGLARPVEQA